MSKQPSAKATVAQPPAFSGILAWMIPNATVFISSGCIMVIELIAGRLIARHLGSSIYTWTSVIGIVLAGIALGNYIGGRLADKYRPKPTIALLFVLSSFAAVSITVLESLVGDWESLWMLSWPMRVAMHVFFAFFFPCCILGTISPVVTKMALDLGRQTGRTIGSIYAAGVVGSLVGTFLTGFYLIAKFGTMSTIWAVACILAFVGLLYGWRAIASAKITSSVWIVLLACLAFVANSDTAWARTVGERLGLRESKDPRVLYSDESQYSYVAVIQHTKEPDLREMRLDKLTHSIVVMEHPSDFQYAYERIYAAITKRLTDDDQAVDNLTIGGGGYVYPRWMATTWPKGRTDAVEIDPAVTRAAVEAFGLPEDGSVRCIHEDGRVYLDRLNRQLAEGEPVDKYDFIYCDAVNDYSVPHQLTTLEFMTKVKNLLRPDGVYLMNVIEIYDNGLLLGSLYKTMKQVFPHVYIFVEGYEISQNPGGRNTFIIMGSPEPFDTTDLGKEYSPNCYIYSLSEEERESLLNRPQAIVLKDDYAPVENLLAAVVKEDAAQRAVGEYIQRFHLAKELGNDEEALAYLNEGMEAIRELRPDSPDNYLLYGNAFYDLKRAPEAEEAYRELVTMRPYFANGWYNLGSALAAQGKFEEAADCYRSVLKINPDDETALSRLEMINAAIQRQSAPGGATN